MKLGDNMSNDIGGVWRTVGGRRIFIKDGQDLTSAMKESGKFNKKNTQNDKEKQVVQDKKRIEELNKKLFGMTEQEEFEFNNLVKRKAILEKEILDEKAQNDESYIQDKRIRDYIYDYTNGDYLVASEYIRKLNNGSSEEEAMRYVKTYFYDENKSNYDLETSLKLANELKNKIENAPRKNNTLTRFEKQQVEPGEKLKEYNVGQEINYGILSTSSNEKFFDKVIEGKDKIESESLMSAFPYKYTELKFVGEKPQLDISKYSAYKDQDEVLITGKYVVEKVENFEPKVVYDEKSITFSQYVKQNDYKYELKTSKKSGKQIINIYNKDGKIVYNQPITNFVSSIDNYYSYKEEPTINDVLNDKVAYKIEKIENKDKSIYGVKRRIVTLRKKD